MNLSCVGGRNIEAMLREVGSGKTIRALILKDERIVGVSAEGDDGYFIYTDSHKWCDGSGAGTFRGDSWSDAIKKYKSRVMEYNPKRMGYNTLFGLTAGEDYPIEWEADVIKAEDEWNAYVEQFKTKE